MGDRARKILLVDDDARLRQAVASCIHQLGAEAVQACDGQEGLLRLTDGSPLPSAILLDAVVSGPGRSPLLDALREPRLSDIPVITMTSAAEAIPAATTGPRHHPYDVEDLARILVSLCD